MFSSLPSASKIYLNSVKPRQKTLSSAKKKRKSISKSAVGVCTPVRVSDEETLVSTTSLRKFSDSQLSDNSGSESVKEFIDECVGKIPIADTGNNTEPEESLHNFKNVSSHRGSLSSNKETISENASEKCQNSESESDDSITIESIVQAKEIGEVTDSIYCDKSLETDVQQENGVSMLPGNSDNLENLKDIFISDQSKVENDEGDISKNVIEFNDEEISSSLPEMQLTTEDSDSLPSLKEENSKNQKNIHESVDSKDSPHKHENLNSDSLIPNCETFKQNCSEKEVISEPTSELKVDKISPDTDCSSVRSDYCTSTDIYDVHVVNSEHSSTEENIEECRLHSPEQSEVSCTESIMFDNKCSCQNESLFHNFSDLPEESPEKSFKKSTFPTCKTDSNVVHNVSNKASDISLSLVNFHKVSSNHMLKRSISLPENILESEIVKKLNVPLSEQLLDVQNKNFSKCVAKSNQFFYSSDKSTNTVNEVYFKASKSTITSDVISQTNLKKDVATTPIKNEKYEIITETKDVSTSLKDSTMLLMKVLPTVGVMQARARSYVFGSIGSTCSLLGNEELSRFFPDNKVTVFVGTWNMNGHNPPECIDDFLLPLDISSVPDIYAIGIQESMQSRSEWEILLQTTLGPSHVLFASTSFGVLHLSIFMRRDLIWFCSEPEEANIATRPGSMIKTKGAVAICFVFFGTSFLFVNSHLTAHEQKLKERLSDYEKICSSLDLPRQIPLKSHQKGKDVTSRFDCVFWCGDLNFRVVQDRPSVLSFVEEKIRAQSSYNTLMKHDQLTQAMAKGAAFHGFSEGVINFIPSYKFDVGTSCFDSAKERVPSYTDRILYRSRDKSSVVCLHYDAVPEIFTSDHKPVFAVFNVSIKPGRDNIPLAAGLFKRDIYLEAVKRRAQQLEVTRNHKQSTICNIM